MPPLIHTFNVLDRKYVFDANVNSIIPITDEQWFLVKVIESGEINDAAQALLNKFQDNGYFLSPEITKIEHPETNNMQYYLSRKIRMLTLQMTQDCNLRCDYCVYSGLYKTRTHKARTMDFDLAKMAIDYVLDRSIDTDDLSVGFYGGEPLLELDLVIKCITYIKKKSGDKVKSFNMTTNGTLLTCEIYEKLICNDVSITISLDGPEEVHDKARKYPDGRGSYKDIMANIAAIQAKHPASKNKIRFQSVVNPEIDNSCIERLFSFEDVIKGYPISINYISTENTEREFRYSEDFLSAQKQELAKFLLVMLGKLKKENVSHMVNNFSDAIHTRYQLLHQIKKLPSSFHPGGPCLAGVQRLFVTVDGDFYPCERVSETSTILKIGDIYSGINIDKANAINNIGLTTAEECKRCWAILHCTMCAAFSDNQSRFSRDKRLSGCAEVKLQIEDMFMNICFLAMHGYDFEQEPIKIAGGGVLNE